MTTIDQNRVIAQTFAKTVARAVGDTQLFSTTKHSINESTSLLMKRLRALYAERTKPLFRYNSCGPDVQHQLGIIYGALLTHMEAVNTRYWVFRKADRNNECLDIRAIEKSCFETAASDGMRFARITARRLPQLAEANVEMRIKAELFAEYLRNNLQDSQFHLRWRTNVAMLYAARVTASSADYEYTWRDTDFNEHGPCGIGKLYSDESSRQEIAELVKYAFGAEASFTKDFNRVMSSR